MASQQHLSRLASVLLRRETRHEKMLWRVLSAGKLGGLQFRRQVPMRAWILDFYCDAKALGIEVDGRGHSTNRGRDAVRDTKIFSDAGVTILRFSNADVENRINHVVQSIALKCGIVNYPQFPQCQSQQLKITNKRINLRTYWHGGNVEKPGNVPEISELSIKACEQIVERAWKPDKEASPCHHAIYTSLELAEQMVRNLARWGIVGRAERCPDCQLIYVLEGCGKVENNA